MTGAIDWISAERQRQHQRVMAEFGDHRVAPSTALALRLSCQGRCFFSASTTSRGM